MARLTVDDTQQVGEVNIAPAVQQPELTVSDTPQEGTVSIAGGQAPTEPKTEVGIISTDDAVRDVNADKAKLDAIAPVLGPEEKPEKPEPIPEPVEQPVATFTNEAGQTLEFTQTQLDDPTTQQTLKDGGFIMSKSSGVNVPARIANQSLAGRGSKVDVTILNTTDDGEFLVQTPTGRKLLSETELDALITSIEDKTPETEVEKLQKEADELDAQIEEVTNNFLSFNIDTDPDFIAVSDAIKQQFTQLKQNAEQINKSRQKALETAGFRLGATQFAVGITSGIVGEEIRQGQRRVAEILNQESFAISQAKQAFKSNKFTDFSRAVTALDIIRDNKSEALQNYSDLIKEANDKLQEQIDEQNKQLLRSTRDTAISDLVVQGITDPNEILNFLNFNEEGVRVGDFTIEEIGNALKFVKDGGGDKLGDSLAKLDSRQFLQAMNLAIDLTKGKGTTEFKREVADRIAAQILEGKTIDDITDDLRFSAQSPLLQGIARDAIEFTVASPNISTIKGEQIIESFERSLENGDFNRAKDLLLSTARNSVSVAEKKKVKGAELGLKLLEDIESDLERFEKAGGKTGIFSGTAEQVANKIGKVRNAEARTIATKIQRVIQSYRQDVSGAAFTESESVEYRSIFPSISNTSALNSAKIKGLRSVWETEVDDFFEKSMGSDAYTQIFKEGVLDGAIAGKSFNITQSFGSLDDLVLTHPEAIDVIEKMMSQNPDLDEEDVLRIFNESAGGSFGTSGKVSIANVKDKSIMRTDRHNNPTAFTVDIARQGGLIEGVDFIVGDVFPDNPSQKTAFLIGDPVTKTIEVIDNIGFFTQGGQQRWTHTAFSKQEWDSFTDEEKRRVIADMYQKEGNQGLLSQSFV